MKSVSKFFCLSLSFIFVCQCIVAENYTSISLEKNHVEYVVANATVSPVREEPSYAGEQATQLLFGEVCEVVERDGSWTKIRSTVDGQVGWVNRSMLSPTTSSPHHLPLAVVVTPTAAAMPVDGGAALLLTLGTRLPEYADGVFEVLGQQYHIDPACVKVYQHSGLSSTDNVLQQRSDLIQYAQSLLNTPYLWGGKNAMGLDCSGFTQVLYAAVGVNILRNAREQITQGELVASLSESLPGDLAFFDQADCDPNDIRITHVGLLLSPTEIIHCAGGRVHIDRIDDEGIYESSGEKTHVLVRIKRYM